MKKSEQLARATIAADLMVVSRDSVANLTLLQDALHTIGDEGYEDYDMEKLRSAGAHLIDTCEEIVQALPPDGVPQYEEQMREIAENFARMRKELAEA